VVVPIVVPWRDLPTAGTADLGPDTIVLVGVDNVLSQSTAAEMIQAASSGTGIFGLNAFTGPGTGLAISGTSLNVTGSGFIGGTNGQVQYNNAGIFGGTTPGPFFIGTDAANLSGTVSTARFNGGTSAAGTTFLNGAGQWSIPTGTAFAAGTNGQLQINASSAFGAMPAMSGDATLDTATGVITVTGGTNSLASVSASVTSAGTSQAGATELTSQVNLIVSGTVNNGVVFRAVGSDPIGTMRRVKNGLGDTQNIYPDGTSSINSLGTSAAYSLFPGQDITMYRTGTSTWQSFSG